MSTTVPCLLVDEPVDAPRPIDYRIAATFEERCKAFRLVYRSYLRAGLGTPNSTCMRVTPYHLLPTTETFIASCGDEVFFTMSLVVDGDLGLPMETIYAEEVAQWRRQGRTLAEVSCLADRRADSRGFFPTFLGLSRLLAQFAYKQGVDDLLIAVHPKHARLYRRLYGFQTFGELKAYPTVRNHPAVALKMGLVDLKYDHPKAYELLFNEMVPDWQLRRRPATEDEWCVLRSMIDPNFHCAPLGGGEMEDNLSANLLELAY